MATFVKTNRVALAVEAAQRIAAAEKLLTPQQNNVTVTPELETNLMQVTATLPLTGTYGPTGATFAATNYSGVDVEAIDAAYSTYQGGGAEALLMALASQLISAEAAYVADGATLPDGVGTSVSYDANTRTVTMSFAAPITEAFDTNGNPFYTTVDYLA
jgi:hypothetical protein